MRLKLAVLISGISVAISSCKPTASTSSLAVFSGGEAQAIKEHCSKSSKKNLRRQMTLKLSDYTTMIHYSPNVCVGEDSRRAALGLTGEVKSRIPIIILRYGDSEDLTAFKDIEKPLNGSGYEAIVYENKSGDSLRTTLANLKATRPDILNSDVRFVIQGHGAIASGDQQHVIKTAANPDTEANSESSPTVKTGEDIIGPLEIITGPGKKCGGLVDSCYSGQVIHDVENPTNKNQFLPKVAVGSASTSFKTDFADEGTVLNAMIAMSRPETGVHKGADVNGDGGVSLDEASGYINGKGGVLHPNAERFTEAYKIGAVSWISEDLHDPKIEDRLKTNDATSRAEIEAQSTKGADSTVTHDSAPSSQMFVGGAKPATEMVLFPQPILDNTEPVFKDSVSPNIPAAVNPDQRE